MAQEFRFEVDVKYLPVLIPLGFRAGRDSVRVGDDGRLEVTFGWFRLGTDLANINSAHITRGYRWWTAVGARMSFVDDGLTFGTNSRAGVCIHFRERVPSVLRPKGHSALTVTVADLDGLVAALGAATP
jgi:hypothetical protein